MWDDQPPGRKEQLSEALQELRFALELLDRASAPAMIGARVDLAIHELYDVIAALGAGSQLAQMDLNAIPQ